MNHTLIIYDEQLKYARGLATYINCKDGFPFVAKCICDKSEMEEFMRKSDIDIALVGKESIPDVEELIDSRKVLLLNDENIDLYDDYRSIYRYQSCDQIMREILQYVSKQDGIGSLVTRKTSLKILGFYSPVRRCFQTSLALTMGRLLSRSCRSLYISLEGFSGLEAILHTSFTGDMADVIYAVNNRQQELVSMIGGMAFQSSSLDILPPMKSQRDLVSISPEEWKYFFTMLEISTDYEYVLVDLSESVSDIHEIMRMCDQIYVTSDLDEIAKSKINRFNESLIKEGYEDIAQKIIMANIVRENERNIGIEDLIRCSTGEYAKKLVRSLV